MNVSSLEEVLINAPILAYAYFCLPFRLSTVVHVVQAVAGSGGLRGEPDWRPRPLQVMTLEGTAISKTIGKVLLLIIFEMATQGVG